MKNLRRMIFMSDVPQIVKDWWESLTEQEKLQWEVRAKNEITRINHEKEHNNENRIITKN